MDKRTTGCRAIVGLALTLTAVEAVAASASPRVQLCAGQATSALSGSMISDSVIAGAAILTAVATIAMARFNGHLAGLQRRMLDEQRADADSRRYPAPILAAIWRDETGSIAELTLQNPSQTPINLYGATIFGGREGAFAFTRPLVLLPGRSETARMRLQGRPSASAVPRLAVYYSSGGRYGSTTIHVTLL